MSDTSNGPSAPGLSAEFADYLAKVATLNMKAVQDLDPVAAREQMGGRSGSGRRLRPRSPRSKIGRFPAVRAKSRSVSIGPRGMRPAPTRHSCSFMEAGTSSAACSLMMWLDAISAVSRAVSWCPSTTAWGRSTVSRLRSRIAGIP